MISAAEDLSDVRIGHFGDVADKVNGNVPCLSDLLVPFRSGQLFLFDVVFVEYGGENLIHRHVYRLCSAEKLRQAVLGKIHGNAFSRKEGHGAQLFDSALDLPDIGAEIFRKESQHVVRKFNRSMLRFFLDNGNAKL